MEMLHVILHFAGIILWYIFKGFLALIVVAIVSVNLVPMLIILGLLLEKRQGVNRQNALTGTATPARSDGRYRRTSNTDRYPKRGVKSDV